MVVHTKLWYVTFIIPCLLPWDILSALIFEHLYGTLSTTLNLNAIDFPTIASSFGQGEQFKLLAQASVPGCPTS
jgi:hypothetical protein